MNAEALYQTNRKRVLVALDQLRTITKSLEDEMAAAPDGVIPWLKLEAISKASAELIYAAGTVNAIVLTRDDRGVTLKRADVCQG